MTRPTLTSLETSRAQLHEARRVLAKNTNQARRAQLMRVVIQADKAYRASVEAHEEAVKKINRNRSAAE